MTAFAPPIQALAARQFGALARVQLLRWLTEDQIRGLVRRRTLVPVERGVYRVAGGAVVPQQAAMAAVLRARPRARLTGPFVLGLFDVDGFTVEQPFEVLTAPQRRLRGVGFPHRHDPLPDHAGRPVGALPTVGVGRALLDAARWTEVPSRRLRVGYDSARWRRLTSEAEVETLLRAMPVADRGARRFDRVVEPGARRPESEGERLTGVLLRRFDPPPEPQVWITPRRRVDWFMRGLRTAVEYLGRTDHASRAGRARDQARDAELDAVGVEVIGLSWSDLCQPDATVAWLAQRFAVRALALGVAPPRLLAP